MKSQIDLGLIPVFLEVVRQSGFSAAARQLGLPRSSVSRQVARLEDQLGVELLRRTTRRVALTEAGESFCQRAAQAVEDLEQAQLAAASGFEEPRGRLRVSAPFDVSEWLAPMVVELAERYPELRIEVLPSNRQVDFLAEGIDVALRAGVGLADSSLVARKLINVPFRLVASAGYIDRHGRPKSPTDLSHHRCVGFRPREGRVTWRLRRDDGREESVELEAALAADDLSFLAAMVRQGAGIGLIPQVAVDRAELRCVLPHWRGAAGSSLFVVYPSARYLPAKLTAFRDHLVAAFSRPDHPLS